MKKRILISVIAALLVVLMALPVFAEKAPSMILKLSTDNIKSNQEFTVTVFVSEAPTDTTSALIQIKIGNELSIVSGEWLVSSDKKIMADFDVQNKNAVIGFSSAYQPSGDVFKFKVKAVSGASDEQIQVKMTFNNADGEIDNCSKTSTFDIVCANHDFSAWKKNDDTNHERECSKCGYVEKASHVWDKGVITKETSCKEAGEKKYTCSTCGATKTEVIPKTENHKFANYTETKKATCTEDGEEVGKCSVCGKEDTKVIKALGHSFDKTTVKVTKEPTCTETGTETGFCTRCQKEASNTIPALGHKFGEWKTTKEPTCTVEGIRERECSACHKKEKGTLQALGHDFAEAVVVKEPTISTKGISEEKCNRCNEKNTIELPCYAKDENTGTVITCNEGVFKDGTQFSVKVITENDPDYQKIRESMLGISEEFVVLVPEAYLNGEKIQPNGNVDISFKVPEGFKAKTIVYEYSEESGEPSKYPFIVNEDLITVSTNEFATFVLADSEAKSDPTSPKNDPGVDPKKPDDNNDSDVVIIVVATAVGVVIAVGGFFFFKKKFRP